jgi:hypothetical protein
MARITDGMHWFKVTFGDRVNTVVASSPYSLNFLTAIAVQESFAIWGDLYKTLPETEVLSLCAGDTIDGPSRKAFPTSKAALLSIPHGAELFAVARADLEAAGEHNAAYHRIAVSNPNKFCHGFGIFQYDIQFCKTDPDYFLQRKWQKFDLALAKAMSELKEAQSRAHLASKPHLTDTEMAFVAIAYNAGGFNPKKGLKQGFKDSTGKFYGELIAQYIALAATV